MSDIVIKVRGLGKKYHIGEQLPQRSLAGSIKNAAGLPWKMAKSIFSGKSLDKREEFWALKDVSFDVKQGEVLGIIGRNGAGKSTLLKILSRITTPTLGEIEMFGRVGCLLEVGTGFHPELTGRENVFLNGSLLGMTNVEIKKRFDEIVDFSGVERFLDTPVKFYSSGMYTRLAFSVAAHLDPEILILDEVLAVGDAEFQKKCLGKMGDIAKAGRTIIFVSHNMAAVKNICQRAILLNAGTTALDGNTTTAIQHYLSATSSTGGEVIWHDIDKAPGNDLVRLHSVRILQDGQTGAAAEVDIAKDIIIQLEYWNLKDGLCLYPAIWLRDPLGAPLLSSGNAPSMSIGGDMWYGKPYPKGLFKSICRIPGNFFNEGTYSVTAIVGILPTNTQILEDYLLSFTVHDTGEMRKEFTGGWLGTVRPKLAWNTENILSQ
ncbi:MAG: ABC transporter ATP-binding protein [Lentisphaerota bacterium]